MFWTLFFWNLNPLLLRLVDGWIASCHWSTLSFLVTLFVRKQSEIVEKNTWVNVNLESPNFLWVAFPIKWSDLAIPMPILPLCFQLKDNKSLLSLFVEKRRIFSVHSNRLEKNSVNFIQYIYLRKIKLYQSSGWLADENDKDLSSYSLKDYHPWTISKNH